MKSETWLLMNVLIMREREEDQAGPTVKRRARPDASYTRTIFDIIYIMRLFSYQGERSRGREHKLYVAVLHARYECVIFRFLYVRVFVTILFFFSQNSYLIKWHYVWIMLRPVSHAFRYPLSRRWMFSRRGEGMDGWSDRQTFFILLITLMKCCDITYCYLYKLETRFTVFCTCAWL